MSTDNESQKKNFNFLSSIFYLTIIYLSIKLIVLPISQTGINLISYVVDREKIKSTDIVKIPDISFPDITLLAFIFLFQPQTAQIFDSLDLSAQGLKASFRELKKEVNETKEELDKLQQKQLDKIESIQQFMYQLLLSQNEINHLKGLKEKTSNKTHFDFYVSTGAAEQLRRLRDSKLIKIKSPYQYISDLQKASNYGRTQIDLTEYCELTALGEKFLLQLEQYREPIVSSSNASEDVVPPI